MIIILFLYIVIIVICIYIYDFGHYQETNNHIHQAQTLNKMTQRPLATGVFQSNTQRIQVTKGIRRE